MGNCCVTPVGGSGKKEKEPKEKKGKKPNPFSIEYNRSALPGATKLVVLREPTGRDIAEHYELGGELGRGEFGVTFRSGIGWGLERKKMNRYGWHKCLKCETVGGQNRPQKVLDEQETLLLLLLGIDIARSVTGRALEISWGELH